MLKKSFLKRGNNPIKKSNLKSSSTGLKKAPIKKRFSPLKKNNKSEDQLEKDKLLREKRTAFYEQCIEKVGNKSAITGRRLHSPNRANYHHVLPKATYTECEFSFNVILPLSLDEHSEVEGNPEAFEQNIEKRKWCLENIEQLKEESKLWEETYMKNKIKEN